MFFVISYSLQNCGNEQVSGKKSKVWIIWKNQKFPQTYLISASWSIGGNFIISVTWPVCWAMLLKVRIILALSPPGRRLGSLACIVVISISLESERGCSADGDTNSSSLEMIRWCFEFFSRICSAFLAMDTSSSPCIQSELLSTMVIRIATWVLVWIPWLSGTWV